MCGREQAQCCYMAVPVLVHLEIMMLPATWDCCMAAGWGCRLAEKASIPDVTVGMLCHLLQHAWHAPMKLQ